MRFLKLGKDKKEYIKFSIKLFFKSLGFRWGLVACLIILPLNILTIVITNFMHKSYVNQMLDAYANQLNIYADAIENEFTRTTDSLSSLLDIETMMFLNLGSAGDAAVHITNLKHDIMEDAVYGQVPKMCYIWEHGDDIFSYFNYNRNTSLTERAQLEDFIREQGIQNSYKLSSNVFNMDDNMIVFVDYNFKHVSFGVGYDVKWLLEDMNTHMNITGDDLFYLVDSDGTLMASYNAHEFEIIQEEKNIHDLEMDKKFAVFHSIIDMKGRGIAQVSTRSELLLSMPVLIRVLYVLAIISLVSLPIMIYIAIKMIIRPLKHLCEVMKLVESGDLKQHVDGQTGSYELDFVYQQFNHMIDEINLLVVNSYEKEIEKLQTDAINMRLQVNQHMLLNFINTIYSLSLVKDTEQIGEFSQLLMKYFRYVLRQDSSFVTIEEEMNFVSDYLKLQSIRFPGCFSAVYSVDEAAQKIKIPQLLIENFVENAVKYGMIMGSEIEIIINIRVEDEKVFISVCDTGNGMSKDISEKLERGEIIENRTGKHIGIWNCRRRMKLYYGDAWKLKINSRENEGTQVWIELPMAPMETDAAAQNIHILERKADA